LAHARSAICTTRRSSSPLAPPADWTAIPRRHSLRKGPVRLGRHFPEDRLRALLVEGGDAVQLTLPPVAPPLPSERTNFRRHQRALNHGASCWNPGICRHPGGAEEYLFDYLPRLWCCQSSAKPGDRPVHVSIENFSKQLILVAKCGGRLSRLIRMALVRLESEAPSKTLAKNMPGALPGSRRDRRREAGQALQQFRSSYR
jgi:hypothetical protein